MFYEDQVLLTTSLTLFRKFLERTQELLKRKPFLLAVITLRI